MVQQAWMPWSEPVTSSGIGMATSQPARVTRIENPPPSLGLMVSPQDSACLSERPHRSNVNLSDVRCQAHEDGDPPDVMSCWLCQKGVSYSPHSDQPLNVDPERQRQLLLRLNELQATKPTASRGCFEALGIPTGHSLWDGLQMALYAQMQTTSLIQGVLWRL